MPPATAAIASVNEDQQQQQLAGGIFHKSADLARETISRTILGPPRSLQDDEASSVVVPTTLPEEDKNDSNDKNLSYDGSDLIEWINANGGFIHENARIGLDPTGMYRGVFVKNREQNTNYNIGSSDSENKQAMGKEEEGIEEGDIIARIPW